MRAGLWVGVILCALFLTVIIAWNRERQRAERMALQNEQLKSQVETLAQSLADAESVHLESNRGETAVRDLRLQTPFAKMNDVTLAVVTNEPSVILSNPPTSEPLRESIDVSPYVRPPITTATEPRSYSEYQLEIYRCANQMITINLVTEKWAGEHDWNIPRQLTDLRGYVAPMTLVCPGARPASLAADWDSFDPKNISYKVRPLRPTDRWSSAVRGPTGTLPTTWLYCPVHKLDFPNSIVYGGVPLKNVVHPFR